MARNDNGLVRHDGHPPRSCLRDESHAHPNRHPVHRRIVIVRKPGSVRLKTNRLLMNLRSLVPTGDRPAFFRVALLLGIAFLGLYSCSIWTLYRHGPDDKTLGWNAEKRDADWVVNEVDSAGPVGKVKPGDVVLAFNGDT